MMLCRYARSPPIRGVFHKRTERENYEGPFDIAKDAPGLRRGLRLILLGTSTHEPGSTQDEQRRAALSAHWVLRRGKQSIVLVAWYVHEVISRRKCGELAYRVSLGICRMLRTKTV